jgi:hypothetical protein
VKYLLNYDGISQKVSQSEGAATLSWYVSIKLLKQGKTRKTVETGKNGKTPVTYESNSHPINRRPQGQCPRYVSIIFRPSMNRSSTVRQHMYLYVYFQIGNIYIM